jgi:hypothetical protein
MKRQSIKTNYLQTICWVDNAIVDYSSAGKKYTLNGKVNELYRYTFGFGDDHDPKLMQSIANKTGGGFYYIQNL